MPAEPASHGPDHCLGCRVPTRTCFTRFTPLLGAWGAVREVTPGSRALCPASLLGKGRGGHPTLQPPMTVSPQMQTTPADGFRWAGFFKFAFKNKKQKHFFLRSVFEK